MDDPTVTGDLDRAGHSAVRVRRLAFGPLVVRRVVVRRAAPPRAAASAG